MRIYEAMCDRCGEVFVPDTLEGDLVHVADANGNPCGGAGTIPSEWVPPHDCWDHAVEYVSDGPLGHGWECGYCGAFLQAG